MEIILAVFDFGKHSGFIWAAYIAAIIVLISMWMVSNRTAKKAALELESLRPARPEHINKDAEL